MILTGNIFFHILLSARTESLVKRPVETIFAKNTERDSQTDSGETFIFRAGMKMNLKAFLKKKLL